MKLTKKSLMGFVSLAALAIGGAPALAAPLSTATPKGEITFTERTGGGDGTVTSPETVPPEVIKPVDPSPSNPGPLMIVDAPKFDFGTVELSAKDELYSAKASAYFKTDTLGAVTAEKVYKAPMVQIEDVRKDTATQTWAVAVSASPFTTAGSAELTGAEIRIQNKGVVFNNTIAAPGDRNPAGISTTTSGYTIGSAPKVVLSSAAGQGNGKSTLVLDSGYKDGKKADGTDYLATDKIEDVQLFVPVTASKEKDALYTSTITWSLYNTPEAVGTIPAP